jgi:hypothetical protein
MPRKLYLYREHTNVGDELIHRVGTVKHRADFWAYDQCKKSGTKNFDVVTVEDGQERTDI